MRGVKVWYVYPAWHRVSFTLIAHRHISELRHYMRVTEVDELAFPHITPHSRPLVILHPYFFIMMRSSRVLARRLHEYRGIIGVDVADSDHISNLAVSMTHYARAMIVPSAFAKRVYEESGVTVPVYVVPHGLEPGWYLRPNIAGEYWGELLKLKYEKKLKLILFYLWHSEYRKGWDLVLEFYKKLKRERKDVILVVKTVSENEAMKQLCRRISCVYIYGWLTEEQKIALYDAADLYPLFSRGGGFEMNGLEAVARLVPVIAAKGGAWEDYLPQWSLVDSHPCPYVLKDNPIHDGRGVEVDVEKAVDRAHDILENLDDYRARLAEWREKKLKTEFNWLNISSKLFNIIQNVVREV